MLSNDLVGRSMVPYLKDLQNFSAGKGFGRGASCVCTGLALFVVLLDRRVPAEWVVVLPANVFGFGDRPGVV